MICTPNAGYADYARHVNSVGSLGYNGAWYGNSGVRPDLVDNVTE